LGVGEAQLCSAACQAGDVRGDALPGQWIIGAERRQEVLGRGSKLVEIG
jgi:hypothetical protein